MTSKYNAHSEAAAWTDIINNSVLAVLKGVVGLLCDSKALIGDALYSASEAAGGVSRSFQLRGFKERSAQGERDRKSLKGSDPLLTILFVVLLLMGVLQLAISAIRQMSTGNVTAPDYITGVTIVIAVALKEAVFLYQYRQLKKDGKEQEGAFLETRRFSLYSSMAVLIGVFGSMAGGALEIEGLLYLDPAAGLLIACFVLWRAYRMVVTSLYGSLAQELQDEDAASFVETVQRVHGVIMVQALRAHEQGHYVRVEAEICVNPRITVIEAKDIANRARALLMHRFSHISDVAIHVVPYDPVYPYKSNHENTNTDMPTLLQ
ncbi:cation transporter [Paenibacillus sp. YPG26]|uniref:cation diffusion facilitator family transporter n=1 Tax=Paenibacillus sp. YPG26 TaxID=2878915 RepID=UPI00203BE2A5|nr:cation transporter [Paenibacillus sp. YPG26]USB34286.1 cation transporter [Paenibacillus sp. YPG26]